jgi:hypothetical protein
VTPSLLNLSICSSSFLTTSFSKFWRSYIKCVPKNPVAFTNNNTLNFPWDILLPLRQCVLQISQIFQCSIILYYFNCHHNPVWIFTALRRGLIKKIREMNASHLLNLCIRFKHTLKNNMWILPDPGFKRKYVTHLTVIAVTIISVQYSNIYE